MIALLCGTVRHGCVLTASGVGYQLDTVEALVDGDTVELLVVEHHTRDGDTRRFGFTTPDQREAFTRMCKLPSVGPAAAMAALRHGGLAALGAAVRDGDAARLAAARGVSAKVAELVVSRLDLSDLPEAAGDPDDGPEGAVDDGDELVAALVALGHDAAAARTALAGTDGDDATRLAAALGALAHPGRGAA